MEVVAGIFNIIPGICSLVYNHIRNLTRLGRDAHEMESLFRKLQARKTDINDWVARGGIPSHAVQNWRSEVDRLQSTKEGIMRDFDLRKQCLAGCCPDCIFRLKLSRRVGDCKLDIQSLSQDFESLNGQFGEIAPPPNPISEERPVGTVVGEAIEQFQRQIEDCLKEQDDRSRVIAVYGMGGVGKTTLLKNINNSATVRTLFDVVIWVTVSQNPNIRELQNSIARRLGFNLSLGSTVEERAAVLLGSLKHKRFLLILDDMWARIDVDDLFGVAERGKILLSTRNKEVCTSMGARGHILELKPLLEDEAWELFRMKAFGRGDGHDLEAIEGIAKDVAAECKGLPLAINVVAAAMPTSADPSAWRTVLNQLRAVDRDFYEVHGGMDRELFQPLRWSYDALSPNHLKICFSLCAAFPEDRRIPAEDLIEYWISEGLVKGRDDEYLFDKGFSFILALTDRSLIQTPEQEGQYVGEIKMMVTVHDVLRDFAIVIGEMDQENKCLFRAGQNMGTFPPEEDTRPCTRISLMQNEISSLPSNFQCPKLLSLVLAENKGIEEIPESFLLNLPSLKVLDLSGTGIRSLPVHLRFPSQLVYLNLSNTRIKELPESIGDLHSLQFLNLSFCYHLVSLSFRVGKLKCLRSLNLRHCDNLRVIPREFSGITSLEALEMETSGVWVGEESESEVICVRDFVNFRRLRKLSLQLKSPLTNGVMGKWTKMRHLHLVFAYDDCQRDFPDDMREMKELERFQVHKCWIQRVPDCICALENLQVLSLAGCVELEELTGLERLPRLKTLQMSYCNKLRALGAEFGRAGGFPTLELLILVSLKSLESVVGECGVGEGVLEEGALPRLKNLTILQCPELRCMPRGMEKLRRLEGIRMPPRQWEGLEWVDESIKIHLRKYLKW